MVIAGATLLLMSLLGFGAMPSKLKIDEDFPCKIF